MGKKYFSPRPSKRLMPYVLNMAFYDATGLLSSMEIIS
jgi:hypothetical protein